MELTRKRAPPSGPFFIGRGVWDLPAAQRRLGAFAAQVSMSHIATSPGLE